MARVSARVTSHLRRGFERVRQFPAGPLTERILSRLPGPRLAWVIAEGNHHSTADGIEWEDDVVEFNRLTSSATTHWRFVDRTAGVDSGTIERRFTVGDRVKIRVRPWLP